MATINPGDEAERGLVPGEKGVRIVGAAQYVRFAYCVQEKIVLDIYVAQNAFFEQEPPRKRFMFQCPDDLCRAALKPKITGVNYYVIATEGSAGKQAPHFRWNPLDEHLESCALVQRYVERMADPAPASLKPRVPISADEDEIPVVEEFQLRDLEPQPNAADSELPSRVSQDERLPKPRITHRIERDAPSSTVLLQQVVESYHRLAAERLAGDTALVIGGEERSYLEWFERVEDYRWPVRRIFHGGARIAKGTKGAWFLTFMDDISIGQITDKPTIVVRTAALERFSRRGILKATLSAVETTAGAYAHCYFFGAFVVQNGRIRADFGDDLARVCVLPKKLA